MNILRASVSSFPKGIKYYHIEFDKEVLVLSNNSWTASYFCWFNRQKFDNSMDYIDKYGEINKPGEKLNLEHIVNIVDIKSTYKRVVINAISVV